MNRDNTFFQRCDDDKVACKNRLVQYVKVTSETNVNAFGEIMFLEQGKNPTYSPYITISAESHPSILWNIFTDYWKLFLPQVIVCTVGKFLHYDDHWRHVCKNSWIITSGSSPISLFRDDASVIAIQQAKSFENWEALHSDHPNGLFPAEYSKNHDKAHKDLMNHLDLHHSHFVFVEGSALEVATFRKKYIDFLGSKPIELDSAKTKFVEIPIVVKLMSDSEDEILFSSRCAMSNHLVIVHQNAKNSVALLKEMAEKETEKVQDTTSSATLNAMIQRFEKEEEQLAVQELFKKSSSYTLMIYPTPEILSLKEAILNSMIKLHGHGLQTAVRLALIWDRVDLISDYLSKQHTANDDLFSSSCLHLALMLGRASFLELLYDAGINVYSSLTVRMLWMLYYEGIMATRNHSSACLILTTQMKKKDTELKHLIKEVGSLICQLTHHECDNIYHNQFYSFPGAQKYLNDSPFVRNLAVDATPLVPHPVRDLFIWSLFTENNQLARVLWKHGHNHLAHALLASDMYASTAKLLSGESEVYASVEHLNKLSSEWETCSIDYLHTSSKMREGATQSMLIAQIPTLGHCSCITLAHGGNRYQFMAEGQVQRIMDIVWNGTCRPDSSALMILLALPFPFLIPIVNKPRSKPKFTFFNNQVFQPFFAENPPPRNRSKSLGIMTRSADSKSRENSTKETSLKPGIEQRWWTVKAFYSSPRITFILYLCSLLVSMLLMSGCMVSMNIYRFRTSYHFHWYWLVWYMLGNFIEDVRSIFIIRASSFPTKLRIWIGDVWHILNLVTTTSYFSGLLVYFFTDSEAWWFGSKVLFGISLICLNMRVLRSYTVSKLLGPLLQMITQMVGDVMAFIAILALLFWAYGIIGHSFFYTTMPAGDAVPQVQVWGTTFSEFYYAFCNFVIRRPYWQIFGQLLGNATDRMSTIPELIQSFTTAVYVGFTSVLLLNLLIAMFSYTTQRVNEHSFQIWAFHRYETVELFADYPSVPSPWILIVHFIRFVYYLRGNRGEPKSSFKKPITEEELDLCHEIENDVLRKYLKEETKKGNQSSQIERIAKRQDEMSFQLSYLIKQDKTK